MVPSPARGQATGPEASTSSAPYGSPPSPARPGRPQDRDDITRSSSAGGLPHDDPRLAAAPPRSSRYDTATQETRRPLGARRSTVADSYENPRNTPNLPPINTRLQPTARSHPLPLSPTFNSSRHSLRSPQQPVSSTATPSSQLSSTSLPPRKSSQDLAAPPFAGSSKYDPFHPPERSTASPAHSTGSGSSHRHPHQHSGEGSGGSSPREREKRLGSSNVMSSTGSREGERGSQVCAKCSLPMAGQFVRALGTVFHLDCFRCQDCSKVVAAKFFPVDASDGSGRQFPLCETDYFRRLNLLCSKCGAALRGSYITALDMKFHVEHFTCSVCPTVFGPQDSYYEHAGSVYCHFHYSTRFAVKCTGCRTAILKQFVEINRNSVDEHWHPECYMIHKFWNIKLAPSPAIQASTAEGEAPRPVESSRDATGPPSRALEAVEYLAQEDSETPASLKDRQKLMEEQVYRIWTVLSAFEESSAACISEMLRHVSSGQYIEGVRMAEKFVLHVETLFSAIDDLSIRFKSAGAKEIAHVREARMLCKKVVNFFSLLSHTHETGARKMSITQELLSLVTGLAHYLKILIRIALTAALKLERDYSDRTAIGHFLNRLDRLARDPDVSPGALTTLAPTRNGDVDTSRSYGYTSLTRAVGTLVGQGEATTDLCEGCRLTVEEESARFGTSLRWHLPCLRCTTCHRPAAKGKDDVEGTTPTIPLKEFRIDPIVLPEDANGGGGGLRWKGGSTYCSGCAPASARDGFEIVTRLEQYAFLLCVALNKLYALLKQRGVVPSSPTPGSIEASTETTDKNLYDAYRNSTDIKRMKSVNLDRHLSSTTARTPKRSTVIQSPTGRVATSNDPSSKPPVPSRKDQPVVDANRTSTLPRTSTSRDISASNQPLQQYRSLPPEGPTPSTDRPGFRRATTAIRIVDEQASEQAQIRNDAPLLGGASEPTQDEDGITLADLPQVMEAEQAREQRRLLPGRSGMLLSELSALEYFIVKHVAALMLASNDSAFKDVAPLDDLLDMIDARKNTFWGKLFKGGNEKKNIKKKGVFGVPLEVLVERNGADSMHGAGPGPLRVPSFVDDCISAMKQMDMSVEGVFRKNGNIRRLKDLSEALDRDPASVNLSDDNPVQLAALLKRFLRDLPDPLMTFKLFQLFIATQRVEDLDERKKIMHFVCCLMPKCHRDTMEAIFVFLKWVASFSHVDEETGSKMDLHNLATVICPNILYSKGKDPYKDESFSAVRAVHELLEYQDEFWQVPPEFASILNDQDLFSNPSQLTSKEILARAENYVRRNGNRSGATTRGEVQPHLPDYRQAYLAPNTNHNPHPNSNSPSSSRDMLIGSRSNSSNGVSLSTSPGGGGGGMGGRPSHLRPVSYNAGPTQGPYIRQPQPIRPPMSGNANGSGGVSPVGGGGGMGYLQATPMSRGSSEQLRSERSR